jgi:hypothetical protein
MPGRHRAPRPPRTPSKTLRAPAREWFSDAWAVLVNTLSPTPAPPTVDAHTTIPVPGEHPDGDA